MTSINSNSKAFTMIELLVVIAVIGILSALIINGTNSLMQGARDSERQSEINSIRKALLMQSNMGNLGYPIQASWCCIDSGECSVLSSTLTPTFIAKLPQDPTYNSANKESCYMYKSNGTTFDLYARLEKGGAVSVSPESVLISKDKICDAGWINTGLGFCVMQYEATNSGGYPVSNGGAPWASINQSDAIVACKSIGAHLINNAEWMAIARDIESVSSNYVGGVLKRGNVGDTIANLDYDGANPENGSAASAPAILSLSNGQTINHLSGNVWEWVDYTITGTGSQPQAPSQGWAWQEISAVTNFGNNLGYNSVGPKNTSLNGVLGAGRIFYNSSDTSTRALLRGGFWGNTSNAGVFALNSSNSPPYVDNGVGFRCAK